MNRCIDKWWWGLGLYDEIIQESLHIFYCLCLLLFFPGNYYGTPKPPAEPSPVQPDLVDQVLFDEEFDSEVQRKRTTSVSKMDRKDSTAPEEEEEEERPPLVNGLTGEEAAPPPPSFLICHSFHKC